MLQYKCWKHNISPNNSCLKATIFPGPVWRTGFMIYHKNWDAHCILSPTRTSGPGGWFNLPGEVTAKVYLRHLNTLNSWVHWRPTLLQKASCRTETRPWNRLVSISIRPTCPGQIPRWSCDSGMNQINGAAFARTPLAETGERRCQHTLDAAVLAPSTAPTLRLGRGGGKRGQCSLDSFIIDSIHEIASN